MQRDGRHRARRIHTIGEPVIRFREDPVRILRAIKFAARLDLGIEPDVYDAMVTCRDELARAARPRVFEEILRLLRGGAAQRSMWLFWELGVMSILLPELSSYLDDEEATNGGVQRFFKRMLAVDVKTKTQGRALDDVVLWASLLQEPLEEAATGARDRLEAMVELLEPIIERVAMPRRIADGVRRILAVQPRLAAGKMGRLGRNDVVMPALDVLEIDWIARGRDISAIAKMRGELPPLPTSPRPVARGGWRRGGHVVRRGG